VLIVCIESPFKPSKADIAKYAGRYSEAELLRQNLIYARLALLNSLMRGEAPVASHLLYTQVWSEKPELRQNGIRAGVELHHRVDLVCLYIDLGVSEGMKSAEAHAELVSCERGRRSILDLSADKDPRELLAGKELGGFPYLDELQATEQGSLGRIKTGKLGA
jgi:hypothetical protein